MKTRKKHAVVKSSDQISSVIRLINDAHLHGGETGIAVVVDDASKVVGVVTDGDIRDAFCRNINFSEPVETVMSKNFMYVYDDQTPVEQFQVALKKMNSHGIRNHPKTTKALVCTRSMEFVDIINLFDLYQHGDITSRTIAVYGMGYVGLTLALAFAELKQFEVIGVDIDHTIIEGLARGIPSFYENGLQSLLHYSLAGGLIRFAHATEAVEADIHVITVGTPIDDKKKPVYTYLMNVGRMIGERLKEGDLVICRSTVPVGTTRNKLIPLLETASGLTAGKEFFVAFAPERTVAGNALYELRALPQVIGGYSDRCIELSTKLFQTITSSVVRVESLEAAEMVKLINNTFRDTAFSFVNEVALICDEYNLDAHELIQAANKGYPRDTLSLPSPGVGGTCLSKDPYLYINAETLVYEPRFGNISRSVNEAMPQYIFEKFKKFAVLHKLEPKTTNVLIIGIPFKGLPETSDVRNSSAMDLFFLLRKEGYTIFGCDFVLDECVIRALGMLPKNIDDGIREANAVFIMNNHPQNRKFDVYGNLTQSKKPFFFFDGWKLFRKHEIEAIPGVVYSTLGYMTQHIKT